MKYTSQGKQLSIDTFRSSLDDCWVQLGDTLPWDEIERLYNHRLNNGKRGAGNKPARMIVGALLIKHKMNLSDEETKELEIQAMGKPLGRPPKESKTDEYQSKMVEAAGERNEIEATFGTGKRIYRANNIRAKLPETADCWTAMCYFVKNVMKFLKGLLRVLFELLELIANPGNNWRIHLPLPEFAC